MMAMLTIAHLVAAAVLLLAASASAAGKWVPPPCNPLTFDYEITASYNKGDGAHYLYMDKHGGCKTDFKTARRVCQSKGLELAPHGEAAAKLCTGYKCWVEGKAEAGKCPWMDWKGKLRSWDCAEPTRFVCRTKRAPNCPTPKP